MEVDPRRPARSTRELPADAFDRLLGNLDRNRDRAGEIYERIRHRLVSLFRWRGCRTPEELADRTFDRVARRLVEGAELRVADPYVYFHGVALNVLREYWREPERDRQWLDAPAGLETAVQRDDDEEDRERRLECAAGCLAQLPDDRRRLIEVYHTGSGGARIEARQALARQHGIPLNALRIRAYRIRATLQDCVNRCMRTKTL